MRVLWVVKGLGPGGAERLLCAAARAHTPGRYEIECAYVLPWKDHLADELERAGVRTTCLSVRRRDPTWPARLVGLVRSGRYDVVHVHSPLPGSVARLAARTLPRGARPALVSTEHNRSTTHRPPTRLLNRTTSRWDDAVITVTDEVRSSMRGRARVRAATLRHGIDVEGVAEARSSRGDVRTELGLTSDEFVVGTVANFRPQKDYPNLLAATGLLVGRGVPIRVVAVGQGPQADEVAAERDRLGLGDRVLLTGFRDDAVRVMGACDAFVLASQWEGLPVAVMEALALGLPIVATAVGGVAEELTDGVDALLVPPRAPDALANAIQRVATDLPLRRRLAAEASDRARQFGIGRTIAEVESIYQRVGRRDGPPQAAAAIGVPTGRLDPQPYEIRQATPDDRPQILDLLGRSLGSDGDARYPALFAWKHDDNHFGASPMWVAVDDGRIVAFRAFMRWRFVRGGQMLHAVRAVDTATDPAYRGQGLFRALTVHGLDELLEAGIDFVFNTPNEQSRPGYLKMGWRDVGHVPVTAHFSGPHGLVDALRSGVPADRWSQPLRLGVSVTDWLAGGGVGDRWPQAQDVRELRTDLDDGFIAWRFGSPLLGYRVVDEGDAAVIVRARSRGVATELAVVAAFGNSVVADRLARRTCRAANASYAIRTGQSQMSSGFVPLPGRGPVLTWRAVSTGGCPPLSNWALSLGDVELF